MPAAKRSAPEVVRFNWDEVVSQSTFCCDRRRKIPQIIAKFPQGVVLTIYGSHCKTKRDWEVSHLIHKSRDVSLEPFFPWEPGYTYKSYEPLTAHRHPRWESMISFSGTWDVRPSSSQKFKGHLYRDALQRSDSGSWVAPDEEMIQAFEFFRHLVRCNLTVIRGRMTLADLRKTDFLQDGLWEGLLPALMKGKFSEAENAFNFAREVESARVHEDRFFVEDHFPFAITPYRRGLVGLCCKREKLKKTNPPSVNELFDYMEVKGLFGTESMESKNFRKNLTKVGLAWLVESRKK